MTVRHIHNGVLWGTSNKRIMLMTRARAASYGNELKLGTHKKRLNVFSMCGLELPRIKKVAQIKNV